VKSETMDAVSKAKTLGAAIGAAGGSPEDAICEELEAYVKERVRQELEEYKLIHGLTTDPAIVQQRIRQQDVVDDMFTQAAGHEGVGTMATVMEDGTRLSGKADAGGIRIIALAMGLDDPKQSKKFKRQDAYRKGLPDPNDTPF